MLQVASHHLEMVNAAANALMVLIWTAYLHFFLVNHLRQARSVIHIDIGAAKGARSRCLVTNLSPNPVYVQGIVADLEHDGSRARTVVTERDEIDEDEVEDPLSRTYRGTLHPGATMDIGSLSDLVDRVRIGMQEDWSAEKIDSVTITVVAIPGHVDRIFAASKTFIASERGGIHTFASRNILTHQIRPRRTRAEFSHLLRDQTKG